MPIENEIKFVLSPDYSPSALESWEHIHVRQGYLDNGARIRKYGDELIFTYKRWIKSKDQLVEIETNISPEDFENLWPECSNLIDKQRYIKKDGDLEWVVDFFYDDNGSIYFVMAEVEMPEDMLEPPSLPVEFRDQIRYAVTKGDERFTSRELSDKNHAETLLIKIKDAK